MSKRKIQSMVLLLGLALISTLTNAQNLTKHEFSIQQCIDYANKNNVQVKNALLNLKNQRRHQQLKPGSAASAKWQPPSPRPEELNLTHWVNPSGVPYKKLDCLVTAQ